MIKNASRFMAALAVSTALTLPATAQVASGQNEPNFRNLIDNGNFNISQRGTTTVSSITTTAVYLQDRWAVTAGTSTSSSIGNVTASLPGQFTNAVQVQRTAAQTGVVNVCLVQEIPTADFTALQGQPVTLSFWALAGSNFSAASSALVAQVTIGTGSDEGLATWLTGLTGAASTIPTANKTATLTTAWQRFAVTGTVAATATEGVVNLCFTPVGTAGANDYFQVTGVQLERGTAPTNFEWRPAGIELARVQRYAYRVAETATITPRATCHVTTAGAGDGAGRMQCQIPFPVPMRIAPTATYVAGFAGFTTAAETTRTACSALAIDDTIVFVNSTTMGLAKCSLTSSTIAVGLSMTLVDNSGSGSMLFSADF